MNELARSLAKLICVVTVKTGEDGKMFGTVTAGAIADQLKTQFDVALDKKKIHLDQPIKALGDYEVELRLHPEVRGTLKVRVESTTPVPPPPPAAAAEAPKEEGKPDRHPRRGPRAEKPAEGQTAKPAAQPESQPRRTRSSGGEAAAKPDRKSPTDSRPA